MVTLTGKITDVTGKAPKSISNIIVKAPSARIGGGSDIIVTSRARVEFNEGTGSLTLSGLHVGLSWLYIEGDGWSDSIPLAVAEGFQLILEAVANASGVPGIADYVLMIRNSGEHAQLLARAAVNGEIGEVVRLTQAAASTASQAASTASQAATSAENTVNAYTPRVDALEAIAGLSPSEPTDGQTANLIAQQDTLTRQVLDGAYAPAGVGLIADDPRYPNRQAALDACPPGGTVIFTESHVLEADTWYIVPRPMTIRLAPGVVIDQPTYGCPIFECANVDNVVIDGMSGLLRSLAPRPDWPGGSFRSDSPAAFWSAVWSNGSYNDFRVRTDGFTCGIYLTGVDETLTKHVTLSKFGNKVALESKNADFGLNFICQVNLEVVYLSNSNTRAHTGSYFPPPHAIYASGNESLRNSGVTVGKLIDKGNPYSYAFQFKYVDNLDITSMMATDVAGLCNIMNCTNVEIGSGHLASVAGRTITLFDMQLGGSDVRIGRLHLPQQDTLAADFRPVFACDCDGVTIESLYFESNITDVTSSTPMAILRGNRIHIDNLTSRVRGNAHTLLSIGTATQPATDVRINNLDVNKSQRLAAIYPNSSDVSLRIDPSTIGDVEFSSIRQLGDWSVGDGPVGYRASVMPGERSITGGAGAVKWMRIDPYLCTITRYRVTDAGAPTVLDPLFDPHEGCLHTLVIENAGPYTVGEITFGDKFNVESVSSPGVGESVRIDLRWDGSVWRNA